METFLMLCDDSESDVRMVADECLNRTIKTLIETNLGRLQVELYKEIKKNNSPRSLRAALWRFADMCHLIRPQKCRPYVVNLLPCLARICRRPEEAIQETLATAMSKICPVLMGFTNDAEVKVLLKSFLPNVKCNSAVSRRTAGSSVTLICQYSRKPIVFFSWLLGILLDMVIPVHEERNVYTLLGVMLCLRHMIPHMTKQQAGEESLKGSFGVVTREQQHQISADQFLQIYELVLYYTKHDDHNVVTAALETLQQLLRNLPHSLLRMLTTPASIHKTSIYEQDLLAVPRPRSGSQGGRLPSVGDDTGLEDEIDQGSEVSTSGSGSTDDTAPLMAELEPGVAETQTREESPQQGEPDTENLDNDEEAMEPEIFITTADSEYSNVEIGDVNEERAMSQSSSADNLTDLHGSPRHKPTLRKGVSEDRLSGNNVDESNAMEIDISEVIQPATSGQIVCREGDIGSITDKDAPLVHCVRLLCSQFLLTGYPQGLIPDRVVRVSVKALALGCIGCAVSIYPKVCTVKVHKSSDQPGELQDVGDVLLYTNHSDPQLKGSSALLIGNLMEAVLKQSRGHFDKWIANAGMSGPLMIDKLCCQLISILEDDSSVATRLAIVALKVCLPSILNSAHSRLGLQILLALLHLKENPYWLVKVELLDVLTRVDFKLVAYLEALCTDLRKGTNHYVGLLDIQRQVVHGIVVPLLGDEDSRVRDAAAQAVVNLVPKLFYPVDNPQHDPVIAKAKELTDSYLDPIMHDWCQPTHPTVHALVKPFSNNNNQGYYSASLESSLSRVTAAIIANLNNSMSKHLTFGCCRALCMLSEQYTVMQYAGAWCCALASSSTSSQRDATTAGGKKGGASRSISVSSTGSIGSVGSVTSCFSALSLEELGMGSGGGSLSMILSLLTSSPVALDLSAHQDALQLAGNLFTGAAYKALRPAEEVANINASSEDGHWAMLNDRLLVPVADQLLAHVARLLNVCSHVIEEQTPGPPQTKPSLPSLPNAPSLTPIKRKGKAGKEEAVNQASTPANPDTKGQGKTQQKEPEKKEPEKDKNKKEGIGTFYNLPHYMKLYEVLKGAYSNYKISLDLSTCDKFGSLLRTVLEVVAQILEIAGLSEIGKCSEEILGYMKSTVVMEPTASVLSVIQLLKSLFGTNLASHWDTGQGNNMSRKPGKATRLTASMRPGLYHSCFTTPYTQLTQSLATATFKTTAAQPEQDESSSLIGWLKKRAEKKIPAILKPGSKADKMSIANYIRLFEPLVIKALKQYTVTSSLELQQQVLNLLAQLVQLRVNYCLLDSDQIFIGFVIKQFEYIEEGQIRSSETLIPNIFNFLVLLSYERYHSKTIIGMPRIIQLCDGIMASGQQPTTHAIPALQPIVHDLFVLRSANKADAGKDVDTQREVVVSMLLRLIQYYQVLEMFIIVLHQCRKESEEKWKRLSRQVTDLVLPLLARQQLNLDNQMALDVLHRLFESVAPSVFRPVDTLLKTLFGVPYDLTSTYGMERWVCVVLAVLRVLIAQSKEEVVLARLNELSLTVNVLTTTPTKQNNQHAEALADEEKPKPDSMTPEATFARLLLQVIGLVAREIRQSGVTLTGSESSSFLCQQMAHLLLYITHMFQSGLFRRVATAAMVMVRQEVPPCFFGISQINYIFKDMGSLQPTLTLQWCNILILLNYDEQKWWSQVMQTPRKYRMSSPTDPSCTMLDGLHPANSSACMEIVRRGSLILFCDYVCENLSDAEHMTWVIINHVNDLIHLSHEPPVQDFISAIHRNSAASGLFIQAIHARCDNLSRPSLVKKTLQCLEAIHLTQSGTLLTLLIDKFLNTHHMAVARICDTIACRRVEMLLAENVEDSSSQLPLEDLEKLVQFMKSTGLTKRHARLASLLHKLRNLLCPESCLTLSPERTHPLVLTTQQTTDITVNKDWFVSITRDECFNPNPDPRECTKMLQRLDYADILSIIMAKEFHLSVLEECIATGTYRTLYRLDQAKERSLFGGDQSPPSPEHERMLDPLLKAAQITLFRHLNNIINMLPVPHQVLNCQEDHSNPADEQYREKMEDCFTDVTWCDQTIQLATALLRYLVSLPMFPWKPKVPEESIKDVARFALVCLELLHWMLVHDHLPSSEQIQITLECCAVVLQNPQLEAVFGHKEQMTWVCSAIRAIHQLLSSISVMPGERLVTLPNQDSQDDLPTASFDDFHHVIHGCDQISELVHCLHVHLDPHHTDPPLPRFLAGPLRNIITGLARLPLVNSYARTPPMVWKLGWMPSPSGDPKTKLPPLPLEYLQDKDILREFICRVNMLGWTSRQQFEETWMNLLGVVNPTSIQDNQHVSPEEDIDHAQCIVLAIRCITSLLVQSTLTPYSGNPSNSMYEHRPRDKPLAFLHTRCGKKLAYIRGLVEREIQALARQRMDMETHHTYCQSWMESDKLKYLFDNNIERELGDHIFLLGQMSIESIWSLLGMLDPAQFLQDSTGSESTGTDSTDTSPKAYMPPSPPQSLPSDLKDRSFALSGLDIHSCLQFLLELYGQFLSPSASPRTPLMQLNETVKSVVALSDIFTERQQFEWMLDVLLEVQKSHPVEDELVLQYVVTGICKAAAVVGLDMNVVERVIKLMETCLKSTHLPTRVGTLYGALYLLETGMTDVTKQIIPIVTDYVSKHLTGLTHSSINSLQHIVMLWACTFYVIENYQQEIKDTEFTAKMLQVAITTASAPDDLTPVAVYIAVMRGLERLLLADILTQQDAESLVKLAVDRLCVPSPQRALAGLALLLTCMYSGKQGDQYSPTRTIAEPGFPDPDQMPQDPESLILAMERVTVLFDRIRKGFPFEARVITRVLPTFLADFFPPQDIMNKVIGEFLSNQQPHPQLMATVVFKVFENLLEKEQHSLVQDWVMLSLSNFTQRTPIAMAMWSLTCFFISASTNIWLRALLPHVIGRMGKMETVDRKFFCIAALDFRSQLTDDRQQRAFQSTFQNVTQADTPYADLLACCT